MESRHRFATFNFVFLAALALLPSFVTAATLTQHLEVGSQGTEVTSLQQLLIGQGYLSGSPTGYFGPLTTAAVANYQSAHGFSPTGTVGPQTRDALNASAPTSSGTSNQDLINALLAEIKVLQAQIAQIIAARNGQTTTPTLTRPLSIGSTGSDVTALQTFLQSSGYLTVPPTGYFGPATQAAVAAYQSSKNLEPVGSVGPKTLALINSAMMPSHQDGGNNGNGNNNPPPSGGGGGSVNSTPSSGGTSNGGGGGGGSPPPAPPMATTPSNSRVTAL